MGNLDNVVKSGVQTKKPGATVDETTPTTKPKAGDGPSESLELWSWIVSQRICELEGQLCDAIHEMHRMNKARISHEELVTRCMEGTAPHAEANLLKELMLRLRDMRREAAARED